jgi:excisionase family DNA binding protein
MTNEFAMADDQRLTYEVSEAGRILGLSRQGAYKAVAAGEIPAIRIGRRLLVPKAALHRMIEGADSSAPKVAA